MTEHDRNYESRVEARDILYGVSEIAFDRAMINYHPALMELTERLGAINSTLHDGVMDSIKRRP